MKKGMILTVSVAVAFAAGLFLAPKAQAAYWSYPCATLACDGNYGGYSSYGYGGYSNYGSQYSSYYPSYGYGGGYPSSNYYPQQNYGYGGYGGYGGGASSYATSGGGTYYLGTPYMNMAGVGSYYGW
jgi:hypothetical protein